MKLYLPIVGLIIFVSFGYQLFISKKLEPTASSFGATTIESGSLQYDKFGAGRAPASPTLNGHAIWCSAGFDGPAKSCEGRMRTLRAGSEMTVKFVELPTTNGPVRVALDITLDSGEKYSATPEQIISDWRSASRYSYLFRIFEIIIVLVIFPAAASKKLRGLM